MSCAHVDLTHAWGRSPLKAVVWRWGGEEVARELERGLRAEVVVEELGEVASVLKLAESGLNDGGEIGVAGEGCGSERVGGDLIREQGEARGERAEAEANGGQTGAVAGEGGAVAGDEGGFHLALFLKGKGQEVQVPAGEPLAEGDLNLGFGDEADLFTAEL